MDGTATKQRSTKSLAGALAATALASTLLASCARTPHSEAKQLSIPLKIEGRAVPIQNEKEEDEDAATARKPPILNFSNVKIDITKTNRPELDSVMGVFIISVVNYAKGANGLYLSIPEEKLQTDPMTKDIGMFVNSDSHVALIYDVPSLRITNPYGKLICKVSLELFTPEDNPGETFIRVRSIGRSSLRLDESWLLSRNGPACILTRSRHSI